MTFSTKSHLEAVLHAWPWKRRHLLVPDGNEEAGIPPAVKEAQKYGLRAISKARWDKLNEEYLIYKHHLVEEMARTQSEICHLGEGVAEPEFEDDEPEAQAQAQAQMQTQTQRRMTATLPYPFDCLVFARNIHPETNKTTLKSLFGQALQDDDNGDQGRGQAPAGLDYVDFTKGMDSVCIHLTPCSTWETERYLCVC